MQARLKGPISPDLFLWLLGRFARLGPRGKESVERDWLHLLESLVDRLPDLSDEDIAAMAAAPPAETDLPLPAA
ncbi:MAG TPA: hypothetical protein VMW65_01535 [Chloroflexota bacterium]|nr:hypothetical protein [Chloroflexota bacterium]